MEIITSLPNPTGGIHSNPLDIVGQLPRPSATVIAIDTVGSRLQQLSPVDAQQAAKALQLLRSLPRDKMVEIIQTYSYPVLKILEICGERIRAALQDEALEALLFRQHYQFGRHSELDELFQRYWTEGVGIDVEGPEPIHITCHPAIRPASGGCYGWMTFQFELWTSAWEGCETELATQPALPEIVVCCGDRQISVKNDTGVTIGQIVQARHDAVTRGDDFQTGTAFLRCFMTGQQTAVLDRVPPTLCFEMEH